MLIELAAWNLSAFFFLLVIAQVAAKEVGFIIGTRKRDVPNAKDESIGVVSGSILGLLAFALAFNLSLASSRFAERREAVLEEANAIGTLWLQAEAVNHPRGKAIAGLAESYIKLRKQGVSAAWGSPEITEAANQVSRIQTEMWGHLIALAKDRVDPQVAQLEASMNAVFDSTTSAQFSVNRSTPMEVVWLLLAVTLISMTVLGYQFGLNGHPHRALALIMVLVWTSVLIVILDLGSARIGDIRVNTSVYDSNMNSMKAIAIPPLEN